MRAFAKKKKPKEKTKNPIVAPHGKPKKSTENREERVAFQ
jgi:hypothetical protein